MMAPGDMSYGVVQWRTGVGMQLGDLIRRVREERGWTQEDLEEISGVSQNSISNIERGRSEHPRWATLAPLLEALNIDRQQARRAMAGIAEPVEEDDDELSLPDYGITGPSSAKEGAIVRVSRHLLEAARRPENCYVVTAPNDAMTHRHIQCGDRLIFETLEDSDALEAGEIVIAGSEQDWWLFEWSQDAASRPCGRFVSLWRTRA